MLASKKLLPWQTRNPVGEMDFESLVRSSSNNHLQLSDHRRHDNFSTPLDSVVLAKLSLFLPR